MELTHGFSVPLGPKETFAALRDIQRIAPCMPGAEVTEVSGETFSGTVTVKVGPMRVTYAGTARFVEVDEGAFRATIEARGTEVRGGGTASATVTTELSEGEGGTDVRVRTDLAITGRPAQFGRGVLADVGDKLLGEFAACLARELAAGPAVGAAEDVDVEPTTEPQGFLDLSKQRPSPDAIDLLDVAGPSVLRRVGPVVVAVALIGLAVWWLRRRR